MYSCFLSKALVHGSRLTRSRASLQARHGPMLYECDLQAMPETWSLVFKPSVQGPNRCAVDSDGTGL